MATSLCAASCLELSSHAASCNRCCHYNHPCCNYILQLECPIYISSNTPSQVVACGVSVVQLAHLLGGWRASALLPALVCLAVSVALPAPAPSSVASVALLPPVVVSVALLLLVVVSVALPPPIVVSVGLSAPPRVVSAAFAAPCPPSPVVSIVSAALSCASSCAAALLHPQLPSAFAPGQLGIAGRAATSISSSTRRRQPH